MLGSLTSLGDGGGAARTVVAVHELVIEFGKNVSGHGTADTPNDPLKAVTHNGHIESDSAMIRITLDGYITGVGTHNNVVFAGTYNPGFSPAAISLGNVSHAATNTLKVDIDGPNPGSDHDQLNHSDTVTLDGTLIATMGFTSAHGDSFQVMTFASRIGVLSFVTDSGLPYMLVMARFSTATNLTQSVELLGGANGNGEVEAADYTLWAKNFGTAEPSYNDGDFNRDGVVDAADYTLWANKFGTMVMGPEPSTLVLMTVCIVCLSTGRRRTRRWFTEDVLRLIALPAGFLGCANIRTYFESGVPLMIARRKTGQVAKVQFEFS